MRARQLATALRWLGLLLLTCLLFGVALRPLWHDDIFWHLRTGELVLHTFAVPRVNSFTHTVTGEAWTSHEWGFACLLYSVHGAFGWHGLVVLMAVLAWLTFAVLYAQMWRSLGSVRAVLAPPLLLIGIAAAQRTCFVLRAALLSSLALALLGYALQRLHERGDRRWLVAILLLFLVWANCHAGVTFGLVVLALHYVAAVLQGWLAQREASGSSAPALRSRVAIWRVPFTGIARERALLTFACAAVTLLNPNGFALWTFPFRVNALFYRSGLRWNMGQYGSPALQNHPFFYLLLVLALLACLPLRRLVTRLRDPSAAWLAQSLCAVFFTVLALRSNRFILDAVVFVLPFCAARWAPDPAVEPAPRVQGWLRSADAVNCGVLVLLLAWLRPAYPDTPLAPSVPQSLAGFIQRERIAGRMFNYEAAGGYLGWRLRQPVYWDGRNDIYGRIAHEFAYTPDFGQLLSRHAVDMLVLDPGYQEKLRDFFATQRAGWALVYFDDQTALYLKRAPRFAALLARHEYRRLRPFEVLLDAEVERIAHNEGERIEFERELDRVLVHNPNTATALHMKGELLRLQSNFAGAYRMFAAALKLNQHPRTMYKLATVAHELGRDDEARQLLLRAREL